MATGQDSDYPAQTSIASATERVTVKNVREPAGVSGNPINLALANPSADDGPVAVVVTGLPSGWTLKPRRNLGTIPGRC